MAHDPRPYAPFDGWRPGVIGEVAALQAKYYARDWGFGPAWGTRVTEQRFELSFR